MSRKRRLRFETVEDRRLLAATADYGDAPDSYGTTMVDDGAAHLESTLRLGDQIDFETDAPAGTTGDAFDDGVEFLTSIFSGTRTGTAAIRVTANAAARLDAWIDFDESGTFDAAESLFDGSVDLAAGSTILTFDVPAGLSTGNTFGRFRLSTAGNLSPTGTADDGEVEDYRITVQSEGSPQINVPGNRLSLDVQTVGGGEDYVVRRGSVEVFRMSTDSAAQALFVNSDAAATTFELDTTLSTRSDVPTVAYVGGDSIDTVRFVGDGDTLRLAFDSNVQLFSIDAIDLSAAAATELQIESVSLADMDTSGNGVVLDSSDGDSITVIDPEEWIMGDPIAFGDEELNTLETVGLFLRTTIGSGWHNLVRPFDVDNDEFLRLNDPLVIINALRRGAFFDAATRELDPVTSIDPFPGDFYDVDNNGRIEPLDVLFVINEIRRRGGVGEGELIAGSATPMPLDFVRDAGEFSRDTDDARRRFFAGF